jgi:YbbR domain-containing protein
MTGGRALDEPRTGNWAQRIIERLSTTATENWTTKVLALLLALIVFMVTRDEITRSFTIPLRVLDDPNRVLLTSPPETVELRVRGPWAKVNRLSDVQLGSATLDLREASPGPMVLDPASIVMPDGVVLDTLEYDAVDLRFEAVVDRALRIVPNLVGELGPDYKLASMRVEPNSWTVRGPASELEGIVQLSTAEVDVSGISDTLTISVALEPPSSQFAFLGVPAGERPSVRLTIDVEPVAGELPLVVATQAALREALPELGEVDLPAFERVVVRGPRKLLRSIAGLEAPLRAKVEVEKLTRGAAIPVTVRFEWSPEVSAETVEQLSVVPDLVRLRLSPGGVESRN